MNKDIVRRIVQEAVQVAAAQFAAARSRDPAPSGGGPQPDATTPPEQASRPPQFRSRDVEYFEPASRPAIEVKDNYNIYHNVFSFITRLRVKATIMNVTVLRQNLDIYLLRSAEKWYTNKLAHLSRIGLRNDTIDINEWCQALETRFRDSPSKSLAALKVIRYTIKNARARRDPLNYVFTLILYAKNVGIDVIEAA